MEQPTTASSPIEHASLKRSAQSLCMACGLCCDGTLFYKVPVEPGGEANKLSARGVEIVSDRVSQALKQPCAAYKNCLCSIYAERPAGCRTFQCKLLRRYKAIEITQNEALQIIRDALAYREKVKQTMRIVFGENNCSFHKFTTHLRTTWTDAASVEEKQRISELFGRFVVLWRHINTHFRDGWLR